jgi:hypothetical protein
VAEPERPGDVLLALDLLRSLVEHGVDFVVIGGFAVAAHGFERATKDVDIVPAPDRGNLSRLHTALGSLDGRPLEVGDFRQVEMPVAFDLDGLAAGGNWFVATNLGRIDLLQYIDGILETPADYEALRGQALDVDLPEVGRVAFAGFDHLVALKRAAGRPQDLADIEEIERARGVSGV